MRNFPSGWRILVGATILLVLALFVTQSGLWRTVSEATGWGDPDAGVSLPSISSPKFPWDATASPKAPADTDSETRDAARAAEKDLASLPVRAQASKAGYSRDQFGPAWADVDGNGCDTRDDILARDLTKVARKADRCTVTSGILADPYTATTIRFTRGATTSSAVQIDHVVALGDAWVTGARGLSSDTREALANDPANLLAVDGPTNAAKGDSDASQWLPPNGAFHCAYVTTQVEVKKKYGLWVTRPERDAIATVLQDCAG